MFKIVLVSEYKLPWLKEVPSLLDSSGVFNFILGLVHSLAAFKHIIKQKLRRHVWQEWKKRVAENSVFFVFCFFCFCFFVFCDYRLFKMNFAFKRISFLFSVRVYFSIIVLICV